MSRPQKISLIAGALMAAIFLLAALWASNEDTPAKLALTGVFVASVTGFLALGWTEG